MARGDERLHLRQECEVSPLLSRQLRKTMTRCFLKGSGSFGVCTARTLEPPFPRDSISLPRIDLVTATTAKHTLGCDCLMEMSGIKTSLGMPGVLCVCALAVTVTRCPHPGLGPGTLCTGAFWSKSGGCWLFGRIICWGFQLLWVHS